MTKASILCVTIITVLFFIPLSCFSQFSVGGSFTYLEGYDKAGIQLRGMYQINKRLRPCIDYTYHIHSTRVLRRSEFNTNLHYLFFSGDKINAYGLSGLNIFIDRVKSSVQDETNTALGLNLGIGTDFKLSKNISGIVEIKHTFGEFINVWLFSAGVVYRF